MSTKYKIRNQEALHFISFATVELIDTCMSLQTLHSFIVLLRVSFAQFLYITKAH